MKQIKFVLIGYGWRADFFHRIAKEMPDRFSISSVVLRTRERAQEVLAKYQVPATSSLEDALNTNPDFVVLCIPRNGVKDYLIQLMKAKIPILCETPPGKNTEELEELWCMAKEHKGQIQVIEQYFLQPYYASLLKIIEQNTIGMVSNMTLSALHGYHAISIFRKILGIQYENASINGKRYFTELTATNSRSGITHSGEIISRYRDLATIDFENGKTAFLDFMGDQYFSLIRTRRLNIQGLRGEVNDMTVRYLNSENRAVTQDLHRIDTGIYNNSGWTHQGIMFGNDFVFENPTYGARLNDDEIAVALCLENMKTYVDTGKDFYSLKEALQDTYFSFEMERAITERKEIQTQSQIWLKKG